MAITLADCYQNAKIPATPETFSTRQAAVTAISSSLSHQHSIILTRLYFGLSVSEEGREWFRAEVAKTDPTFSLVQREREVAVLAEAILWTAASAGNPFAATAVVAASAVHTREPLVQTVTLPSFEAALKKMAKREHASLVLKFQPISPSSVAVTEFVAATSLAAAGELYSKASEDLRRSTQTALTASQNALVALADEVKQGREQGDILSWLVGGWSRLLNRPISALGVSLAAVAVGIDLADISLRVQGPYAADALAYRALQGIKPPKGSKLSFQAIGDSATPDQVAHLAISENLKSVADLCPVLTALSQSAERGREGWALAFQKATGIDVKTEFNYAELALQVLRERMLVEQL